MNFNRVIQPPQIAVSKIKNIQQSPIKYNVINQQSVLPNYSQNGYLIQNGNVQTYYTPIKQTQNRSVPQIGITPGINSSAQTIQMSPFQSYNSKILTAGTVKGMNEIISSNNQQFLILNQQQNAQIQDSQSNILDITHQVPQPPRSHHQSKRIFDDAEQVNTSYGQKLRANQSSIIENNTSLGNISQRGNLRNSSFIRNAQFDKDQNMFQKQSYDGKQRQYQGNQVQRNSSLEQNNRSVSYNLNTQNKNAQNDLARLKKNLVFEKINKQSFGSQQNINIPNSIGNQNDLISETLKNMNNQQFTSQSQTIKRNNIFNTNSNSIKVSNNTSGSLFILNTSQDQASKLMSSPSNYQSNERVQTQQSQIQKQDEKQIQTIKNNVNSNNNNLKIDLSQNTLNVVKYTPKQEIFSFENSQIYIEDQVETPLAPHMFQHDNFTQSNINSIQNADTINFFSTNQNEQISKFSKDKNMQEDFNSHDYKVSLLEVTNNDTYESNKISCQIAGNSNNEKNEYIKEFDKEQQLKDQQKDNSIRFNEIQAENIMLRNNLQEIKEMYNNQQINISKFQNVQEENNQLKLQIVQLQQKNKEQQDIIKDLELKNSNHSNYYSNENSARGERKSQNALNEQLRELQEKNDVLSKEKVSLMELLLNQEKLYNQLSQDFQKQQNNTQESQRFSQPVVAPQIQAPHPKYIQQLEEQVQSLETNIETLKVEIVDKDNLIQQMQFDLKDSQKQLGLFTDQILVLKEKLEEKDNQRQIQLENELIAIQIQNKNLLETNNNLQKHIELLEQIKTNKPPQQIQQLLPQKQEHQPQRVQLSKYFDQNRENDLQIKPSLGGQAYLNANSNNNVHINYQEKTYTNKQNYDKFMSNGSINQNHKFQSVKNQNQILFTVNSNKKL